MDDNLIAGPCKEELKTEMEAIFQKHPGKIISNKTEVDAEGYTWKVLDFLGANLWYSRERKSFRINMKDYIEKVALKLFSQC